MVFFFFSFLASLFGGITAGSLINISAFTPSLNVAGPLSAVISFWPFIIVFSLLLLAVLWFQTIKNLRNKKTQAAKRTRQTGMPVLILAVATVFVILLAFTPYLISMYTDNIEKELVISEENRVESTLTVHGMTCTGCESLINRKVGEIKGVESVVSSHTAEEVTIVYDKSRVTPEMITQAIENSGYKVISEE